MQKKSYCSFLVLTQPFRVRARTGEVSGRRTSSLNSFVKARNGVVALAGKFSLHGRPTKGILKRRGPQGFWPRGVFRLLGLPSLYANGDLDRNGDYGHNGQRDGDHHAAPFSS